MFIESTWDDSIVNTDQVTHIGIKNNPLYPKAYGSNTPERQYGLYAMTTCNERIWLAQSDDLEEVKARKAKILKCINIPRIVVEGGQIDTYRRD